LSQHVLVRSLVAVVCLGAIAWLAFGLRATVLENSGRDALEQDRLARTELADAIDDLRAARRLNAGSGPRLVEARLLATNGRPEAAVAMALEVVDDEPENLEAWAIIHLGALATGDEALARRSLEAIRGLNPQLAERISRSS
jgi:hypothetical protein